MIYNFLNNVRETAITIATSLLYNKRHSKFYQDSWMKKKVPPESVSLDENFKKEIQKYVVKRCLRNCYKKDAYKKMLQKYAVIDGK